MVSCDECVACCIFLSKNTDIPGKLELIACKYLGVEKVRFSNDGCNNCTIYETRPEVCRQFNCDYLLGKEDERPDKARDAWLANPSLPVPKFLGAMWAPK